MQGKVVVITGASSGLGKCLAEKLAKLGATLVLIALDEPKLEKLAKKLKCDFYSCNIGDLQSVDETFSAIFKKYKRIDILINNAGIWTEDSYEEKHPEMRFHAFETNVIGHINVTNFVLPYLKRKNSGIIANVISTCGNVMLANAALWKTYSATKFAMVGYSNALRNDLAGTKIKVFRFFPGGFESNFYEEARGAQAHNQPWMMKTEDVADVMIFALTRPADVYVEEIVVSKMQ